MKRAVFLWLLLPTFFYAAAQEQYEFIHTRSNIIDIPSTQTYSTSSIANYIQANFKTEKEKLYAAYTWVINNIKYDTDSMYIINSGHDPNARITAALRRRKGVCENYAAIFCDIASKCKIPCYEVSGYTKQYGNIDRTAHMWCAAYVENKWLLCDPTWDAGFNNSYKYFLTEPEAFIESHMPFDPMWQLLDHTISHKEFRTNNFYSKKDKPFFAFTDSVNKYSGMNELEKLESTEKRIMLAGISNELIRINLAAVQMHISILYQDKNEIIYNAAVLDFNKANSMINSFIEYRNQLFIPVKPAKELHEIFTSVDGMILSAYKNLDELDHTPDNFQYDPGILRNRLQTLSTTITDQKKFLQLYFAASVNERLKLFYK